jgi:hypothetical protein
VTHIAESEAATADAPDAAPATAAPHAPEGGLQPARPSVHRLRDLDRRRRVLAAVFAVALLLAPALAFAWAAPDWTPANDPGLMGLRARDVGTERMTLLGQPSTSALYVEADQHVNHPGPLHFYLMAGPVRLFGAALAMLSVSLVIVSSCLVVAAWATFRQLGPTGGVIGAVTLGAITFTTGAAALVNPVSSMIAGYPLLCSMVLLWCLVAGDLRLLPLAVALVSFTAQQHLSVLPAMAVAFAAAIACLLVAWGRDGRWRERARRRDLAVWGGWSTAVGLALWSPVLLEEVIHQPGNLSRMIDFAGSSDRPTMGLASGFRQVAHVLGLPPMLGNTSLRGTWFISTVSPRTCASAIAAALVVAALGWHWRRTQPRRSALAVMVGVVAIGGLANGSSVPEGIESWRIAFYHWAFALAFFVTVVLALGAIDLARRWRATRASLRRPALAIALMAIVVPSLVNPTVDRPSNTPRAAYSPVDRGVIDELRAEVLDHRAEIGDEPLLVVKGGRELDGLNVALALQLDEHGFPVLFPGRDRWYVADERLGSPTDVDSVLVLVVDDGAAPDAPAGDLVAGAAVDGFDAAAYDALVDQMDTSGGLELNASARQALGELPDEMIRAALTGDPQFAEGSAESLAELSGDALAQFVDVARLAGLANDDTRPQALLDPGLLEFLHDHPLTQPTVDPELVARVADTLPDEWQTGDYLGLRVYRLDGDDYVAWNRAESARSSG